ncbi:MAG: hypothetical protein COA57_15785 [Flavobacteriales bacterium]|nr:MAG: hypothetical protein COA57_15785 [Flavobacteriales bacterium]
MKRETITAILLLGALDRVLACSGPGAADAIRTSIEIGNYCAFGSIVLTLILIWINRKKRTRTTTIFLSISILLTVIHPGFWLSAVSGDCGMLRFYSSIVITCFIMLILLVTIIMNKRKPAANNK